MTDHPEISLSDKSSVQYCTFNALQCYENNADNRLLLWLQMNMRFTRAPKVRILSVKILWSTQTSFIKLSRTVLVRISV